MDLSVAQRVAMLPKEEQEKIFEMTDPNTLYYDWSFWARPAQMVPEGHTIHALVCGRGFGKALEVNTKIPTPNGWEHMGNLRTGGYVLGSDGKPTRILKAWHPYITEAFCVNFSDGTSLVADIEHQWRAKRVGEEEWRVVTTADLFEGQWVIPTAKAVDLPRKNLPFNPYLLGRRIGRGRLRRLPSAYLRSSLNQRGKLYAGILDHAKVYYSRTDKVIELKSKRLAEKVAELVRTLGESATVRGSRVIVLTGVEERRVGHISPYGSAVVRCITVDSPDSCYLAGEEFIVTHNTRTVSEWVREKATKYPKCRIALVGRTTADVIGTMINGESGILAVHPDEDKPEHQISKRRLVWPNGSIAETFSSMEPSQIRGPQFHFAACDELGSWLSVPDDSGLTAWDNIKFATRLEYFRGAEHSKPQILVATTPKRSETIMDLFEDSKKRPDRVKIVTGSTFDNVANLSQDVVEELQDKYAGTDIGRQELYGELLEDIQGVMWDLETLNSPVVRVSHIDPFSFPLRIVSVDPSTSENPRDECGIVVLGITGERKLAKRHAFVLQDASGHFPPSVWAQRVVDLAEKFDAKVVVEKNQGGDVVPTLLKTIEPNIKVYTVWAKGSKSERAQPVVTKYQRGRVHHVGYFPDMEAQMTTWDPEHSKKSPDRVDALVWGVIAGIVKPPEGLGPGSIKVHKPIGRLPVSSGQMEGHPEWYRALTGR